MMIEMTETQAEVFLLLSKANVWDLDKGSIEIHFVDGRPQSVKLTAFTSKGVDKVDLTPQVVV